MIEIKTGQTLEAKHLFSFRGLAKEDELHVLAAELNERIKKLGAKQIDETIVATYSVGDDFTEVEMLIPIDREVSDGINMRFKEGIKIVNALMLSYKGNIKGVTEACEKLNDYIIENKLKPITAAYSISKVYDVELDKAETEIYIGINPNVT